MLRNIIAHVLILVTWLPAGALADECEDIPLSLEKKIAQSDLIFSGRVKEVKHEILEEENSRYMRCSATVELQEVWKGILDAPLYSGVLTFHRAFTIPKGKVSGKECSAGDDWLESWLTRGNEYLFYTRNRGRGNTTNATRMTQPFFAFCKEPNFVLLKEAEDTLAVLKKKRIAECAAEIKTIQDYINEKSICDVDADCDVISVAYCPLGCSFYVNKQHKIAIEEIIKSYKQSCDSTCEYSCVVPKTSICNPNTKRCEGKG